MRKLRSRLSLFSRKEGQPSASRDSVPTAAEARRRLKSRGFWRLWIIKINLSGHKSPARASLPFFINLDVEVEKEWEKLFFLVFIGFSILAMLTLRCVKMAMRGCPLCKR